MKANQDKEAPTAEAEGTVKSNTRSSIHRGEQEQGGAGGRGDGIMTLTERRREALKMLRRRP